MNRLIAFTILIFQMTFAQTKIEGTITTVQNGPIPFANIVIDDTYKGTSSNAEGYFKIENLNPGNYTLKVTCVGYKTLLKSVTLQSGETIQLNIQLENDTNLDEVELFGNRFEHPDKIEAITRLPLAPYEQIQSISIISDRLITQQGNLTIADATRNVPGVYTFATYGNRRESMSSRGFRGIPILKNGVRINSDFRGQGFITDMQGVDNIQVLKGAAAITQGVATDLGSPGGVINIVTKTPKNYFGGNVSAQGGSFGQARTTFDVYGPLDDSEKIAFRIDGALERADSYRYGISSNRFYINPSLKWQISEASSLILEMDLLDDSRTPDLGTINLGTTAENNIYDLPNNVYLSYDNDKSLTKNTTYAVRFNHDINNELSIKASYFTSDLELDSKGATLGRTVSDASRQPIYNQRVRAYSIATRDDKNSVLQIDLIGDQVKTGRISHTFQVGFDYRTTKFNRKVVRDRALDTIDIFAPITHVLPSDIIYDFEDEEVASSRALGFVAQDVISFNSWFKTFLALRFSKTQSQTSNLDTGITESNAITPLVGVFFTPFKNINTFASYTNSSYPRTAIRVDVNGNKLGDERFDQLEAGIKTNWLDGRLRFNFTFFKINNKNMNMLVYDEDGQETNYYEKGGNDERKGIEVELTGRITNNLEVIMGYSHIDAQYKEHTQYVLGSAPLNTPKHTFNTYANYQFKEVLKGLSVGAGVYFTGERPIDDWRTGDDKPFTIASYTQANAKLGYRYNKHWNFRFFINNIFNQIGYNAYRTSFINQTMPRNFAATLTYSF